MSNPKESFEIYNIVSAKDGKVVARFLNREEATKAKDFLNKQVYCDYATTIRTISSLDTNDEKSAGLFASLNQFIDKFIQNIDKKGTRYIKKTEDKAFVKYENFWWFLNIYTPLESATLFNIGGGKISDINVTNCPVVEAKDWKDLDWKGTDIYNDKYKTGWLNLKGNFFGCDYRHHDLQAELVHGKSEKELEESGYIKLTYNYSLKPELVALLGSKDGRIIPPTNLQMAYLKDSEIVNMDEVKYRTVLDIDASVDFVD